MTDRAWSKLFAALMVLLGVIVPVAAGGESTAIMGGVPDVAVREHLVDASFDSHLPVLVVEFTGRGDGIDSGASARVSLFNSPDGRNSLLDAPETTVDVSMTADPDLPSAGKIGYSMELTSTGGESSPSISLAGLPPDTKWVLRGSTRDKGMVRNGLAYALGNAICPALTPKTRFCEVIIRQDGRLYYQGIYILSESVERFFGELAAGVEHPILLRYSPSRVRRLDNPVRVGNKIFAVVWPDDPGRRRDNAAIRIREELTSFDNALNAISPSEFLRYESMVDMQSLCDFYILNLLMLNARDSAVSFYLYRDERGLLRFLPDWDFDTAVDGAARRSRPLPFEDVIPEITPPSLLSRRVPIWRELERGGDIRDIRLYPVYQAMDGERFLWFDRLFLSRTFIVRLNSRYHELRRSVLSARAVGAMVDAVALRLGPALERDWERWRAEYAAVDGELALRPFVDDEGRTHVRRTRSYDEDLVKTNYILRKQDGFIMEQLERLEWLSADLFDKDSSGNLQAAYGLITIVVMFILMHLLTRKI